MPTKPEPKDGITARTAGAQGVELKVTVSEQREKAAADAFKLDPGRGNDGESSSSTRVRLRSSREGWCCARGK